MKMFAGKKPLEQIIASAKEQGYTVCTNNYNNGSDWINLVKDGRETIVNVVNGKFLVGVDGVVIATENSSGLDGTPWYDELLNLLFTEVQNEGK